MISIRYEIPMRYEIFPERIHHIYIIYIYDLCHISYPIALIILLSSFGILEIVA